MKIKENWKHPVIKNDVEQTKVCFSKDNLNLKINLNPNLYPTLNLNLKPKSQTQPQLKPQTSNLKHTQT